MRRKFLSLIVVAVAFMFVSAGAAFAGIASSMHNLSPSGTGPIHATGTQLDSEICAWCHTPHAANSQFTGAPIWNKGTDSQVYTMYGTTVSGTQTKSAPNPVSLACLSCHDGASAINSVILQPGQSGSDFTYVSGGTNVAFSTTSAGTAFKMPSTIAPPGTSLQNTHPVSVPYTSGVAFLAATGASLTNWAGASTVAQVLFTYSGTQYVECGSCHDPHITVNVDFLRANNSGSALCISCHAQV